MNKEDVYSLLVYIGMIAIAFVVGFCVLQPAITEGLLFDNQGILIGYTLASIVVGILVNVLLMELGHVIGALVGGYEVISFNVLGFCIYKVSSDKKTKWKFKFPRNADGLAGETIISPKTEKANPMFYVFMPLVFILLECVAMYCVFMFIPDYIGESATLENPLNWLKYGVIIVATIACMFCLYNYFPAKIDSTTDGYRLTLLTKKINVEAYNEYLRILSNNLIESPEETFKTFDELTDFTAKVNMLTVYNEILNKEYINALVLLDKIIESKSVSKSTKLDAKIQKSYIYFVSKPVAEAKDYFIEAFKGDDKRYVVGCSSFMALRTYLLFAGLWQQSKSEVEFCLSKKKKCIERTNPGLLKVEETLFNEALEIVKKSGLVFEEKKKK